MPNESNLVFLRARRDFDHSVHEAIEKAATKFHEQTGLVPSNIRVESQFDCEEPDGSMRYVLKHIGFDFNLDKVC